MRFTQSTILENLLSCALFIFDAGFVFCFLVLERSFGSELIFRRCIQVIAASFVLGIPREHAPCRRARRFIGSLGVEFLNFFTVIQFAFHALDCFGKLAE